jgi:hypothetical protein
LLSERKKNKGQSHLAGHGLVVVVVVVAFKKKVKSIDAMFNI